MISVDDGAQLIFHMCRRDEWHAAQASGHYQGSSQDRADGFIHFSTATQLRRSAEKHRAGQRNLVLLQVRPAHVGEGLRWEPSRSGEDFPHVYGDLRVEDVDAVYELPLDAHGHHLFPEHIPDPRP